MNGFEVRFEAEDGHTLSFPLDDGPCPRVEALGYAELVDLLNGGTSIPLRFRDIALTVAGPEHNDEGRGTVSCSWVPPEPVRVFILVEGGWLPPGPWVNADYMLLDRNIVIGLEALLRGRASSTSESEHFWVTLLKLCQTKLHLLSFALEGRESRRPEMDGFMSELARASTVVLSLFPRGVVAEVGDGHLRGARGLLSDFEQVFCKTTHFLGQVFPLLEPQLPKHERYAAYNKVMRAAKESKLSVASMPVMLAISCLFCGTRNAPRKKPFNPGRLVLKPSRSPTRKALYNAAFDTWLLQMLVAANGLSSDRFALATRDIGLAAAWAGIRPHRFRMENGVLQATVTLSAALFPAMPENLFAEFASHLQ